jgi:L,D-peptidoglycan transpeptidase YkuD (ErfK/YbiS/YcfS/YnhG family)
VSKPLAQRRRVVIETRPGLETGRRSEPWFEPQGELQHDLKLRERRRRGARQRAWSTLVGALAMALVGVVLLGGTALAMRGAHHAGAGASTSTSAPKPATAHAKRAAHASASASSAAAASDAAAGSGTVTLASNASAAGPRPAAPKKSAASHSSSSKSVAAAKTSAAKKSAKPAKSTKRTTVSATKARATASAPKTLPEQMKHLPSGTGQLIVVTGSTIGSKSGTLALYQKKSGRWAKVLGTKAYFGANGLIDGTKRKQGHLQTPTGIWQISSFLFGQNAAPPSGTKMTYRHITSRSWWSCARNSTYNTWVNSSSSISGEHLADATVQYQYALDSGYNAPPNTRVIGRGTAIFIHCSEPAGNSLGPYTHGCVAIPPAVIKRLFRALDPSLKPACAIGTLRRGTGTAIWAY